MKLPAPAYPRQARRDGAPSGREKRFNPRTVGFVDMIFGWVIGAIAGDLVWKLVRPEKKVS